MKGKIYLNDEQTGPYVLLTGEEGLVGHSVNLKELIHCVVFGKGPSPRELGVPPESITFMRVPFDKFRLERSPVFPGEHQGPVVCYILRALEEDRGLRITGAIIYALNCLLKAKLCIMAPAAVIESLRQIANGNISFVEYVPGAGHNGFGDFLSGCDLLLASKDIAINGLLNGIPVIVIGDQGLGGLVTRDNIGNYMAAGFTGRIGGGVNERISVSMLLYEMDYALDLLIAGDEEVGMQLACLSDRLLEETSLQEDYLQEIDRIVRQSRELCAALDDGASFLALRPCLASSVRMEIGVCKTSEETVLVNMYTNKILAVAGKEEMEVIRLCKGAYTINEIADRCGFDEPSEIGDLMRELWEERIVLFNLSEFQP